MTLIGNAQFPIKLLLYVPSTTCLAVHFELFKIDVRVRFDVGGKIAKSTDFVRDGNGIEFGLMSISSISETFMNLLVELIFESCW